MVVKGIPHEIGAKSFTLVNVYRVFIRDNELLVRVRGEDFDRSIAISETDVDIHDA
jgi:hypothetical protein